MASVENQVQFMEYVKKTISKAIKRVNRGIQGSYPFDNLFIHPRDPTTQFPLVERFYMRPIFVWVPEFFWPTAFSSAPPCPNCKNAEHVHSKGWNTESRRAIMRDRCCDLICYRYVCLKCESIAKISRDAKTKINYTFNGWDPDVLSQLPKYIQDAFPFLLTARSGILLSILDNICDDVVHGRGFTSAREKIQHAHLARFYKLQVQYYDLLRCSGSLARIYTTREKAILDERPTFSKFDDSNGYNGFVPSTYYLEAVWYKWCEERTLLRDYSGESWNRQMYIQRVQQTIDGCVWSGDASHKISKLTIIRNPRTIVGFNRSEATTRPIYGIFTMFNEYEQVLWQQPMATASLKELREELKLTILRRFIGHGFKLPAIFYTDDCCDDREILQSIFDELKEEGFSVQLDTNLSEISREEPLPEFHFPAGMEPACVFSDDHISAACLTIREEIERYGSLLLGLDCEWQVSFNSEAKPPATIQLSTSSGKCFLFHLIRGNTKPRSLPKALEQLLEDDTITKVGAGIKGDCTRLEKAYDVTVKNAIDVAQFASSRKMEFNGRGLRDLVRLFLLRDLPKDPKIRNSNWQAMDLTREQIMYACLDAYASVQVYIFIENNCGPIWRAIPKEEDLPPNQHLLLYAKESMDCVGEGVIVAYNQEKYGRYHLQSKHQSRKVVRITKVLAPLARLPYPNRGQSETMKDAIETEVLWDVSRIRLPGQTLPHIRENHGRNSENILETYTSPSDSENFFISPEENVGLDTLLSVPGGIQEMNTSFFDYTCLEPDDSANEDDLYWTCDEGDSDTEDDEIIERNSIEGIFSGLPSV